ncbi:MAG TPA: VOC family protein [Candidatus Binataceae bacterium]|nr:VOC family protein [Candidatus Binataceae bacterium]
MAKIRHIAIMTDEPYELAEFYRDVFGMTIRETGSRKAAWVTDGYIEMALLPRETETSPKGINHFGFTLDSGEEREQVVERLKEFGCKVFSPGPGRPYAEEAARDLHGNRFDLAVDKSNGEGSGWVQGKGGGWQAMEAGRGKPMEQVQDKQAAK